MGRQFPPEHANPLPHEVPLATAGCVHAPAPSHWSVVHAFPSLVHGVPAPAGVTVHPPAPLQVDEDWHSAGEQLLVPLPSHALLP